MAHFAELNNDNVVIRTIKVHNDVITDENGVEKESLGIEFCKNLYGGRWIQTSYNDTFRKNYATSGWTYDPDLDAFFGPQPYPSWILNKETCWWEAPVAYPEDGLIYRWNETTVSWEEVV